MKQQEDEDGAWLHLLTVAYSMTLQAESAPLSAEALADVPLSGLPSARAADDTGSEGSIFEVEDEDDLLQLVQCMSDNEDELTQVTCGAAPPRKEGGSQGGDTRLGMVPAPPPLLLWPGVSIKDEPSPLFFACLTVNGHVCVVHCRWFVHLMSWDPPFFVWFRNAQRINQLTQGNSCTIMMGLFCVGSQKMVVLWR